MGSNHADRRFIRRDLPGDVIKRTHFYANMIKRIDAGRKRKLRVNKNRCSKEAGRARSADTGEKREERDRKVLIVTDSNASY